MSRSYKKHNFRTITVKDDGDAEFRRLYHRARRRSDKQLLHECETYYKDCEIFKPYKTTCFLSGEVCDIDTDAYYLDLRDPHDREIYKNNIVNPEEILNNVNEKRLNKCIGCNWSENCWEKGEFVDQWSLSPDEKINMNNIDRNKACADPWSWPSDGGVYYNGNKNSIREEIEKEFFGLHNFYRVWINKKRSDIWSEYQKNSQPKAYLTKWGWFERLFVFGLIPKTFKEPEELVEWFRKNENKIIDFSWKWTLRK